MQATIVMNVQKGIELMKANGGNALVCEFVTTLKDDTPNLQISDAALIDVEEAFDVLRIAGVHAFAIYLLNEATGKVLTVGEIAETLGLTLDETQEACYRLGLYMLHIER